MFNIASSSTTQKALDLYNITYIGVATERIVQFNRHVLHAHETKREEKDNNIVGKGFGDILK